MSDKLNFRNVSFTFGTQPILQDFNLQVRAGEFVSVIGPSGVGKSTLFRLASGLLEPTDGTIELDGHSGDKRLGRVGYMPQRDMLMPWRTIAANAALPLEIQGVSKKVALQRVREQLPTFGLEGYADAYPEQLSGGMRQRVSLLRATLTGNDLLLLDEPFSALDGLTRMEMQEWLLEQWQRLGHTVVLITHDIDEAILLADRVVILPQKPIRDVIEVPVPIARPRRAECRHEPAFGKVREEIWNLLRGLREGTVLEKGSLGAAGEATEGAGTSEKANGTNGADSTKATVATGGGHHD
ncbi:MAG TPA: ABC transporter ATP-binding protein [Bacilli bacterium]|nr:ABC transporter ATP-binding protein [Bacilli bacterium]